MGERAAKILLRFAFSRVVTFFAFHKGSSIYTKIESTFFQMIRFGLAREILIAGWSMRSKCS